MPEIREWLPNEYAPSKAVASLLLREVFAVSTIEKNCRKTNLRALLMIATYQLRGAIYAENIIYKCLELVPLHPQGQSQESH